MYLLIRDFPSCPSDDVGAHWWDRVANEDCKLSDFPVRDVGRWNGVDKLL